MTGGRVRAILARSSRRSGSATDDPRELRRPRARFDRADRGGRSPRTVAGREGRPERAHSVQLDRGGRPPPRASSRRRAIVRPPNQSRRCRAADSERSDRTGSDIRPLPGRCFIWRGLPLSRRSRQGDVLAKLGCRTRQREHRAPLDADSQALYVERHQPGKTVGQWGGFIEGIEGKPLPSSVCDRRRRRSRPADPPVHGD